MHCTVATDGAADGESDGEERGGQGRTGSAGGRPNRYSRGVTVCPGGKGITSH